MFVCSSFSCTLCWDEKTLPVDPQDLQGSGGSKRKAPSGLSDHDAKICEKILLRLFCHRRSVPFHLAVPKTVRVLFFWSSPLFHFTQHYIRAVLQVKHYYSLIKKPIDFVTIRNKLRRQHFNHYDSVLEFIKDMRLVFSNCVAFNGVSSTCYHLFLVSVMSSHLAIQKHFRPYLNTRKLLRWYKISLLNKFSIIFPSMRTRHQVFYHLMLS